MSSLPAYKFCYRILLKLHQIVVLVNLFKCCKGDAPSITGVQDDGGEIFNGSTPPLTINCNSNCMI